MGQEPFGAAVAAFYEEYMVPMVFAPYADDLVARLSAEPLGDVLEIAAGTGVVTRRLASVRARDGARRVATDLSQAMLDLGRSLCPDPQIAWQQADAASLPFADESFDLVLCQFGAMFFKDRPHAYAQARRVLRPGGRFLFSVWDTLETNDFANTVSSAVAALFAADPPSFFSRVPHGYHDVNAVRADLERAGFDRARTSLEAVTQPSVAPDAAFAARAFVQGTPLRGEIEARDPAMLDRAVSAAEQALHSRFGNGPISGNMRAFVVSALR